MGTYGKLEKIKVIVCKHDLRGNIPYSYIGMRNLISISTLAIQIAVDINILGDSHLVNDFSFDGNTYHFPYVWD